MNNNEKPGSKNSAAASSSKQSSSSCLEEPAEEKGRKRRTSWSRSRYEYPGAWYVSHEGHLLQPTTNKLVAEPAAKGRDNEGQMRRSHMLLRSCRDVRRPRGTCPKQKLPLFFNRIQMGPRKTKLVFQRPPDRGGILK